MSNLQLTCDFCGQQEKGKGYLQRHFDRRHRKFLCNVCNQVYSQKANLLEHLRSHFESFICQYCGLEIYRFEQFQKHVYHKHEQNNKLLLLSIQPKESYKCRHCIRIFPTPIHRNCHEVNVHKGRSEAAFKCKECNIIFVTKEELRSHSFEHYVGMLHFCAFPECDRFFKTKKQLRNHTKIHGQAKYECDKCEQKFFQSSNYSKHKKRCKGHPKESKIITKEEQGDRARVARDQFLMLGGKLKEIHGSKSKTTEKPRHAQEESIVEFLEEYSEEVIPTLNSMKKGMPKKKSEKRDHNFNSEIPKKCVKEESNFITKPEAGATRPCKRVKQEKLFICDVCAFTTSTQSGLKFHMKKHKESLICCKLQFNKKTELNKHKRLAHNVSLKKRNDLLHTEAYCDICGLSSRSLKILRRHMKQHLEPKQKCNICQKELRDIAKHMKNTHESTRFVCTTCNSSFKTSSNLKSHMRIHDEPKECPICHKLLPNLARHIKWHSRPKAKIFSCPQCGKICSSKQSVEEHVHRIHEKMPLGRCYTCPVCNLNFIRNHDLRRHSFIHYAGKIYNCDVPGCNEMFKNAFKLNSHMMVHNPTQEANFQCSFCDRKYLRKTALHKHQKQAHAEIAEKLPIKIIKKRVEYLLH